MTERSKILFWLGLPADKPIKGYRYRTTFSTGLQIMPNRMKSGKILHVSVLIEPHTILFSTTQKYAKILIPSSKGQTFDKISLDISTLALAVSCFYADLGNLKY
jgi:hypothetical protein